MDLTSTKSSHSVSDISNTSSVSAKIKRLQIEESLLLQSITKCINENSQASQENDTLNSSSPNEFKYFTDKAKNKYREIKLLFQDIQTGISSKELLQTLDIDEVKKSTLELENRIRAFKSYLQSELARLKAAEVELNQNVKEDLVSVNKFKKNVRIQTAKYNEIVPSPVKTMISSPFKCVEVQQFQEFMMNSPNRYGGWNEYHHNIFVNHWQKYLGALIDGSHDEHIHDIQHYPGYDTFLSELLPKLQGIHEQDVISHIRWYLKYIYLKKQQQKAIDQWRSNRRIMKSVTKEQPTHMANENDKIKNNRRKSANDISKRDSFPHSTSQDKMGFIRKCYSQDMKNGEDLVKQISKDHKDIDDETIRHFQKATKQWCDRLNSKEVETKMNTNSLENIKKLRVPDWRAGL
ncbi:coiled-coil domain-containing protein 112-like isoform X2 [Spodoptera frugiperda]|uniref:Coiled-coil domain-containing protein 112-like isoform X2 n=1 Tax=Spodoptera frugiperda TaxID=7108 RepID=A0A9R0CZT2_SPOFR|nr:coiled-coil domain-containing protein 112-like isoform X2 [Spodoptera frugiperda]